MVRGYFKARRKFAGSSSKIIITHLRRCERRVKAAFTQVKQGRFRDTIFSLWLLFIVKGHL
jgi:hypothetical protein